MARKRRPVPKIPRLKLPKSVDTGLSMTAGMMMPRTTNRERKPKPHVGTVTQSPNAQNRVIVERDSFNVAYGGSVHFDQPDAESILVIRVTGTTPSNIVGRMTGVGRLVLINPNGILFSPSSVTDLNGLVATTLDAADNDLLTQTIINTTTATNPNGSVIGQGSITTRAALTAFVAPGVANSGTIQSGNGVALASGRQATIDLSGPVQVSLATTQAVTSPIGTLPAMVSNSGQIVADGATLSLVARADAGIVDDVIQAGGTLQARSASGKTNKIHLHGGDENTVRVTGILDATGGTGLNGGAIEVLGEYVELDGAALLDASGAVNGGTVRVGGDDANLPTDRSGTGGVKMAVGSMVGKDVILRANAGSGTPGTTAVTGHARYHEGDGRFIVTALHGGAMRPAWTNDRDCSLVPAGGDPCVTVSDSRTRELAQAVVDNLPGQGGQKPHHVELTLHRIKVDGNRTLAFVDLTSEQAGKAHIAVHRYIERAQASLTAQHGRGLLLDVHGTSHTRQWLELGYNLLIPTLNGSDTDLNASAELDVFSMRSLVFDNATNSNFAQIVRGAQSFGAFLSAKGYEVVPSPAVPGPGTDAYFNGGYTVERHGSAALAPNTNHGTHYPGVDAIQIEVTASYRITGGEAVAKPVRDKLGLDLATSLVEFLAVQY